MAPRGTVTAASSPIPTAIASSTPPAGSGPTSSSEADTRYYCAQRTYSVRNENSAKVLFDSCLVRHGHTP